MATMTNLPIDLAEEILCRVPWTCTRALRSTCKKWNTLSKDESFTKKHLAQEATPSEGDFVAIVLMNCSLNLMSVNLHNNSVKSIGKLISLNDDSNQLDLSRVCHCDGLLLCTTLDYSRLVVWNPYIDQPRWICVEHKFVHEFVSFHGHALGYDKNHSFKILRYVQGQAVHEIYELSSNSCSWRVLDITLNWEIDHTSCGLSLKGNTYWVAHDRKLLDGIPDFLLCFDFTTERFGPRLPLPFESSYDDAVTLSSVRDEQLAVLFQRWNTFEMEVWVSTKIEPNAVSWSQFLAVDMNPLTRFRFSIRGSFLIDEEKGVVVVFNIKNVAVPSFYVAYIIGQNGSFTELDVGKRTRRNHGFPFPCSYVPSSVQINQPA